jgi:hypothetical protein
MGQKINLQPRDINLLQRLCQFGYLKLESISEFIFRTSYKNTSRRLVKLRNAGLVTFIRRTDCNGTKVYIPILKNIKGLVEPETWERGQKICSLQPWFFRLFAHSDQVQFWALRVLNEFPEVDFKLEYLLEPEEYALFDSDKQAHRKVPDFLIEFDDGKQIAFEVELHPKSSEAYSNVFMNMFGTRKCPVVYFTRTQATKTKVKKIADEWVSERLTNPNKYPLQVFVNAFDDLETDEQFRAALKEATDVINAERAAELKHKQIVEAEKKAREEKQREEERLRAERLAQLTTTSAQTPPPLHSGKGFARDQQDGQGVWEDTRSVWEKLGDYLNEKF